MRALMASVLVMVASVMALRIDYCSQWLRVLALVLRQCGLSGCTVARRRRPQCRLGGRVVAQNKQPAMQRVAMRASTGSGEFGKRCGKPTEPRYVACRGTDVVVGLVLVCQSR